MQTNAVERGTVWRLEYQNGSVGQGATGNPWRDSTGQPRWLLGSFDGDAVPHEPVPMVWTPAWGGKPEWGTAWGRRTKEGEVDHPSVHAAPAAQAIQLQDDGNQGAAEGHAIVAFIVPQSGVYRIHGVLAFEDAQQTAESTISWKIVRTRSDAEDTTELAAGVNKKGDSLDLKTIAGSQQIVCSEQDHISIAVWRNAGHYYCSVALTDYEMEFVGNPAVENKAEAGRSIGLRNRSFEDGAGNDRLPKGWQVYGTSLAAGGAQIASDRAHKGKHSLKLDDASGDKCIGLESSCLPAAQGSEYTASGQIYNEAGRGWISLQFYDQQRRRVGFAYGKSTLAGQWQGVRVSATCPPEGRYAAVAAYSSLKNIGTSYFDALALDGDTVSSGVSEKRQAGINRIAGDIPNSAYPRIKDGHLWADGRRLKLWGSQGGFGAEPRQIDEEVQRFRRLGFNLYRSINVSAPIPTFDYSAGDGSSVDVQDYSFAAVAKSGGYVWLDLLNGFRIAEADADLADDPAIGRQEWLDSVGMLVKGAHGGANLGPTGGLMYWDVRSKEAYLRYIDALMTHRNPYRGLTYAQDPSIAAIELMNEQWWLPRALGGAVFDGLPAPLMRSLLQKWNRWLAGKYGNTRGLGEAWGPLLPSESLEGGKVLLQPLQGKAAADAMSHVLGIAADYAEGAVMDVPESRRRKEDVVGFLMDIHLDFVKEATARIRAHGRPGRGAAVVPIVIDTGASYCMPSQYEHTFGSALACATYVHQFDTDSGTPTDPWLAALRKPPAFNGWVDQNKIENIPTFIYEMMFFQPGKYRADFAPRLLGLATIQDFDVIDWHYYQPYSTVKNEPLRMPTESHYWNGVIYGNDEVAMATMMLSATIFRYGDLVPPRRPTTLVIGGDLLYDMESLGWGKLRPLLSPTVFQYGLRLRFDPSQRETRFIGPTADGQSTPDIVQPTPQIAYHWKDGYLAIQSRRVLLVAGFLPGEFLFKDGSVLSNLAVNSPAGVPYVIPDERYVCFAMCSRDGQPLEDSGDIVAMAVSTSWNSGFAFDAEKWQALQKVVNHAPLNAAKCLTRGTLPINVCRVGWTFSAPWLSGLRATRYDFALNAYKEEDLKDGRCVVEGTDKLFCVEFKKRDQ